MKITDKVEIERVITSGIGRLVNIRSAENDLNKISFQFATAGHLMRITDEWLKVDNIFFKLNKVNHCEETGTLLQIVLDVL